MCEAYTRQAIEQATAQNDTELRLWLASHLGWLFVEEGRLEEALNWLHGVEEEICALNQPDLLVGTDVLNYLGQAYLAQGELDRAEAYETRFLELAEQVGDERGALVAQYYLGRIQLRRGQVAEAERRHLQTAFPRVRHTSSQIVGTPCDKVRLVTSQLVFEE